MRYGAVPIGGFSTQAQATFEAVTRENGVYLGLNTHPRKHNTNANGMYETLSSTLVTRYIFSPVLLLACPYASISRSSCEQLFKLLFLLV